MKGAQYLAYPPVVAGGPRANTIHYISNNQLTQDGEMVLMDAGTCGKARLRTYSWNLFHLLFPVFLKNFNLIRVPILRVQ